MSDVVARLVDDKQRERLVHRFGSGALNWVEGLPDLVAELAGRWGLTVEGPGPHGQTSVVIRCRRADGSAAVLKVSPDPALIGSEGRTLALWESTHRVPTVHEVDGQRGGLLLEAIEPGRSIAEEGAVPPMERVVGLVNDLQGVALEESVLREMYPLDSRVNFVFGLWERARAAGPAADLVPAALVHHGRALARGLACGDDNIVPLHGDLHPGNVLDGGAARGLVAIDPRGCLGDAASDAIEWAVWKAVSLEEVDQRIAVLAPGIGVPQRRLRQWCVAFAPLFATAAANRGRADSPEFKVMLDLASC